MIDCPLPASLPPGIRSEALLPLFNVSGGYMQHKASSSVLASLAAGVPLLAPRGFLQAYRAFGAEHVLLMVRRHH